MQPTTHFPHDKLMAYRLAVEVATEVKPVADAIPRGYRTLADQMLRASMSTVLLIAEGANRRGAGEKRHRYSLARGECGELAAALELAGAWGLGDDDTLAAIRSKAARVGAMLTALERRWARAG
jgi:four helix bundle protein